MKSTIFFTSEIKNNSYNVPKSIPNKIVEGVINHFPFRAAVEMGKLRLTNSIKKAAKIDGQAQIEITRIGDEGETRLPKDFQKALDANRIAKEKWNQITPMSRRDWILSITTAKQQKTRQKRIDKTCDMLEKGKGRICCFPGIRWMTKDYVKPSETWQTLKKA